MKSGGIFKRALLRLTFLYLLLAIGITVFYTIPPFIAQRFLQARLAAKYIGFQPSITINSILLAVGVSSAIGVVFGIFPALRAANLDPVESLRYE